MLPGFQANGQIILQDTFTEMKLSAPNKVQPIVCTCHKGRFFSCV
jgi:hypothetical protein